MMEDVIIRLQHVRKELAIKNGAEEIVTTILPNISFEIKRGEFAAITGPSGSGKTTLLYLMGGLDKPNSGSVFLDNDEISAMTEEDLAEMRNAKLGFVYQFHFLLPEFSAVENVMMPMLARGRFSVNEAKKRAAELLSRLGMSDKIHNKPKAQLSSGFQERSDSENTSEVFNFVVQIVAARSVDLLKPIDKLNFRRERKMERVITKTDYKNLKLFQRGKVRDIYDLNDSLLFVVSDRVSAFDVILPNGIPFKGKVLNQISNFWFDFTRNIVRNHVVATDVKDYPPECKPYADELAGRSVVGKKTKPLPVECIVRGYITGTGWNDYRRTGAICGINLPKGLRESERLPEPIFTPSTKAEIGVHDENISFEQVVKLIGRELAEKIRDYTVAVYKAAAAYAEGRGIIIADTKLEFGLDENGEVILIDEVLTPDSSRFWDKSKYEVGKSQPSFDKQFVRDYLLSINFDKKPPAPNLPDEIVQETSKKYLQALKLLAGIELA